MAVIPECGTGVAPSNFALWHYGIRTQLTFRASLRDKPSYLIAGWLFQDQPDFSNQLNLLDFYADTTVSNFTLTFISRSSNIRPSIPDGILRVRAPSARTCFAQRENKTMTFFRMLM